MHLALGSFLCTILISIETALVQLGLPDPAAGRIFEIIGLIDVRVRLPGDDFILKLYGIDLNLEID